MVAPIRGGGSRRRPAWPSVCGDHACLGSVTCRGALAAGVLAGTIGYFMMASFNNPFLYIQISAVVYPLIGYALVMGSRMGATSAAGVCNQRRDRPRDDLDVEPDRPAVDVGKVEPGAVVELLVESRLDLPETRDPGLHR